MAIEHKDIADGERHEPKGSSSANAGDVLTANGDGTTKFDQMSFNSLKDLPTFISYSESLSSYSTATSQSPSTTDIALQIEFGASTSNDDISLASDGVITFTNAGQYLLNINLQFGRTTLTGTSTTLFRLLKNGSQIMRTNVVSLTDLASNLPINLTLPFLASSNDTLALEIIRDSSGVNDGGLVSTTPTASGWNTSPTASITISKFKGLE